MAVPDVPLLHHEGRTLHVACGVLKEPLLLILLHDGDELSRLFVVVVVILSIVIVIDRTASIIGRLGQIILVLPHPVGVRVVVYAAAKVAIHSHRTIAMEVVGIHLAAVDRYLVVVHSQPIALCITVGEEPALQHAVRRVADAGNAVAGLKAACSTSWK